MKRAIALILVVVALCSSIGLQPAYVTIPAHAAPPYANPNNVAWLELTDTPGAFSAKEVPSVNAAATALVFPGALFVDPATGGVSVGSDTPAYPYDLSVVDETLDTQEHHFASYVDVHKTAGASNSSDGIWAQYARARMSQAGGTVGWLAGSQSAIELDSGEVTYQAYGGYGFANLDGGLVAGDAMGLEARVDQESSSAVEGNLVGLYTLVDADGTVTGTVASIYMQELSAVDYGIYQDGSAPSHLGGDLRVVGAVTISQTTSYTDTVLTALQILHENSITEGQLKEGFGAEVQFANTYEEMGDFEVVLMATPRATMTPRPTATSVFLPTATPGGAGAASMLSGSPNDAGYAIQFRVSGPGDDEGEEPLVGVLVGPANPGVDGDSRGLGAIDFGTYRGDIGDVARGSWSTISGGAENRAGGPYNTVGGGWFNKAWDNTWASTICGGEANLIYSTTHGTIGGGVANDIRDDGFGFIGGGFQNRAQYWGASVVGGVQNEARGAWGAIGGGFLNTITAKPYAATIGGGVGNSVTGGYGVVGGGYYNAVTGIQSTVAGGQANLVIGEESAILGGYSNEIRAYNSVIGGGYDNEDRGTGYNFIGGGLLHLITNTSSSSVIGGGWDNYIGDAHIATIVGGESNVITSTDPGRQSWSFIGGGSANSAYSRWGSVIGGYGNTVRGDYGTVLGGRSNAAIGEFSVASGKEAHAPEYGQYAHAAGRFDMEGSAQYSRLIVRDEVTHDDVAWRNLYLDGGSDRPNIASNYVWTFRVQVVGASSGAAEVAGFEITGVIENDGGTTVIHNANTSVLYRDSAAWGAQCVADDAYDSLMVQVRDTDGNGQVIHWVATIELTQVYAE